MLIKRLELLTLNLSAQRDFYAAVMELPTRLDGDSLFVTAGETLLVFTQAPAEWRGAYHFCFNIPENRFDQAHAWISSKSPLLKDDKGSDQFQSKTWNASSLYFKDAEGNILEFIARHDQRNASDAPFGSGQVLNVSEIGLPSQDVVSFANELCETLGVSVYKQDVNDTFTPIGDEEGLLILPVEDRIWYPNTGVPARLLSIKVELVSGGKDFVIRGTPYEVQRV